MRVLFVHSRMVGGGIERVTLTLIEEFQKRGIDCCLALRHAKGDFIGEANALTGVVEVAGSGMHQFIPRLSGLIRDFEPTHIVTAMPDITLLSFVARWSAGSTARVIQGVHLTQARVAHPEGFRGWLRNKYERSIGRFVYGRVDAAVETGHSGLALVTALQSYLLRENRSQAASIPSRYRAPTQSGAKSL